MSAGGSPPKPWERPGAGATSAAIPTATATVPTAAAAGATAPDIPVRPDSLNSIASRTASNYASPFNRASPYSSPYGYGGGYGNSYSSPYNRFGGGGYGSMYGGGMYGNSPYGMGGYGGMGGMYGAQGGMYGPGGEQSLTQTMNNSTAATFQMIESIVGAFGGFAQMLESTYMATHSSFFAMVSVAEQFGTLRQTLGSVLGIFTIIRWIRTAIAKLTGRPPPASPKELTPANFAAFNGTPAPDGTPGAHPQPSRKPFIFFVVAVFGLPYLMGKLIRALAASQEAEQQRQLANSPEGQVLDPSKLDFCRVLYDYTPQTQPGQPMAEGIDLSVKKGDLVAILSKADPMGQPSEWWRCRARDGRIGYLPAPYLETIQRRPRQPQLAEHSHPHSPPDSRVNTMTASIAGYDSRANSMRAANAEQGSSAAVPNKGKAPVLVPVAAGKPNDVTVDSFQRGAFYP